MQGVFKAYSISYTMKGVVYSHQSMSQDLTHTPKRESSLLLYPVEVCHLKRNESNMKNDDIRPLAFGQYILFIYQI